MEKSLVDVAWTCGCGALNAGSREICGRCDRASNPNKIKQEPNEEE